MITTSQLGARARARPTVAGPASLPLPRAAGGIPAGDAEDDAGDMEGLATRSAPSEVTTQIRLIGPPAIERGGRPVPPPRGRKAWAVLCYLLLADRAPSRRHLADLLLGNAADPLGALRWILAELRRTLGAPNAFRGDPVSTALGDGVWVDVLLLTRAPAGPDAPLLELDGELLDSVEPAAAPGFDSWLLVARHQVAAAHEARLRNVAVARLAAGQAGDAVRYAAHAVSRNPFMEHNHELLARAFTMAGDHPAARRQLALAAELRRRELVDAGPAHTSFDPDVWAAHRRE
ncbi:AfsR/SARP family transcriptional regulator [Pseudofrankia saprophytica]|uniref:AfsR/SARP family transcriptional regulator n=1 Tax=Pseudofrankia saprophytica TaxID=298655 RepID=UPI000234B923|nr:transcriptional regulator, SARP family [Pseudofrankia saprophytica]